MVPRWADELGRCHGCTVLAADGHRIGTVRRLQYRTHADCPDSLAVRQRSIFAQPRETIIQTEDVAEVRPTDRLVLLR
jgi:hypothetical protein